MTWNRILENSAVYSAGPLTELPTFLSIPQFPITPFEYSKIDNRHSVTAKIFKMASTVYMVKKDGVALTLCLQS